jgi:hypothetical protein
MFVYVSVDGLRFPGVRGHQWKFIRIMVMDWDEPFVLDYRSGRRRRLKKNIPSFDTNRK